MDKDWTWQPLNEPDEVCQRWYLHSHREGGGHYFSIQQDGGNKFWLIRDPGGDTPFRKTRAVGGPFDTLDAAKVAYIVRVNVEGWR